MLQNNDKDSLVFSKLVKNELQVYESDFFGLTYNTFIYHQLSPHLGYIYIILGFREC